MTRDELLKRFQSLRLWTEKGERAPYKPITVLYALGRWLGRDEPMIRFAEADSDLQHLFSEFGPPRRRYQPLYPFTRLNRDGIWEIDSPPGVIPESGTKDARKSDLIENDVRAGLSSEVLRLLQQDRRLIRELVFGLLDAHFPLSLQYDLLAAVGIDPELISGRKVSADPNFRVDVLKAYEWRCAVCGYDVRLRSDQVGLEAAHVRWRQAMGPDQVVNGICLCVLHHKLFDRGAFTLLPNTLTILLSDEAHGTGQGWSAFLALHGQAAFAPQHPGQRPEDRFLKWHENQVFRGKPRYLAPSSSER